MLVVVFVWGLVFFYSPPETACFLSLNLAKDVLL